MKAVALVLLMTAGLMTLAGSASAADVSGKEVFDHYCTYCHGAADGPGTMQLSRTRGKAQALLAERTNLPPEYIRTVVRHGLRSMPPFVPSDLTDGKLDALVRYLSKSP